MRITQSPHPRITWTWPCSDCPGQYTTMTEHAPSVWPTREKGSETVMLPGGEPAIMKAHQVSFDIILMFVRIQSVNFIMCI